jgi:hypothetical protein
VWYRRFEGLATGFQPAQPNARELSQQAVNLNSLVVLAPLPLEFGSQPISQETEPRVVPYSIGAPVRYRAHSQIVLEVTERAFNLQQILVMAEHTGTGNLLGAGVGSR